MSHVQTTYEATCHVFRTSQIISLAQYNQGYPASSQHRLDVLACKIQGPCLHLRARESVERLTHEAEKRFVDDFQTLSLSLVLTDYVEQHGCVSYCVVLQCLASRYLRAGVVDPEFLDKDHPYRSSPQFSLMFWNLGRSRFNKCPLPEKLQKFETHIKYVIDRGHEKVGDKPQFNNYFINVVKNLGAHLFVNCEAQSLYPHRSLLEEEQFKTCMLQ